MVSPDILPLRIERACVHRRGARLLGPVDLTIGPEGITVIIGPNGSGKSTLLRLAHGLVRPSAGQVRWAGNRRNVRAGQSFIFQSPVVMHRPVRDNLAYPLVLRGTPRRLARARADGWLEKVGLAHAGDLPGHALSGGERQKMALARALITEPRIVFLDEPCASLDGRATREIETLLRSAADAGTRLVMSTHDIGQARRLASEIVFLHHGTIREHAPAERFFARPTDADAAAFIAGEIVE